MFVTWSISSHGDDEGLNITPGIVTCVALRNMGVRLTEIYQSFRGVMIN